MDVAGRRRDFSSQAGRDSFLAGRPDEGPVPPGRIEESRILLRASGCLTGKADTAAALRFLKSDGSLFSVRILIAPLFTGKKVPSRALLAESVVARELLAFCRKTLTKEVAREIHPYPDWRRPCPPPPERSSPYYGRRNQIPVLEELAAFMADPAAGEHAIRRRQGERVEAEDFIRSRFLDLDCETVRKGTPHTLLCTKNDRSHRHELEWRKKDEKTLLKLEAL